MTDKLTLYNLALAHLNERKLSALSEAREPRRVLDDFWDHVVGLVIEETYWNIATRTVSIDASATVEPAFGYEYAFAHPTDFVRLVNLSTSPTLLPPLLDYRDEGGYLFANTDPLYLEYISSDNLYGYNLGSWPETMTAYCGFLLAEHACVRITGSDNLLNGAHGIIARCYKAKRRAKANDAMNSPPRRAPLGSWVGSRGGSVSGRDHPGGSTLT